MGSGDLVTGRLTGLAADLTPEELVERLQPAASSPGFEGHSPAAEVRRKAQRRSRQHDNYDEDEYLEISPEAGGGAGSDPAHKIDRLA